ncbi:hypothetical protein [Zobellia uliginosa]|nr:hypothetical protein [Zobellia uliginosa]
MFGLLVVTLIAAALTETSEIQELKNDGIVGEQFAENMITDHEVSVQQP